MASTAVQRARGKWLKGQSGNPSGRPAGRPNRSHAYLRALMEEHAERVIRAIVVAAAEGDMVAAKLVIDRVLPRRVCRPLDGLVLPTISTMSDACAAMSSITNAALQGAISTAEAAELAAVVETYRRTVESTDVLTRLERLEMRAAERR